MHEKHLIKIVIKTTALTAFAHKGAFGSTLWDACLVGRPLHVKKN